MEAVENINDTVGAVVAGDGYSPWTIWAAYIVGLTALRVLVLQFTQALSRSKLAEENRITKRPIINEKQHQRESVWPMGFILDAALMVVLFYFGLLTDMPLFDGRALLWQFAIHCTVVEFVYYWLHRALHWKFLYKHWHQYHHASVNTEPTTALSFELGERLVYTALFAVTPIGSYLLGHQSYATLALHLVWFDVMNYIGHINFEFFPTMWCESLLALTFYTPSYHSIHHTRFKKNYSLFMTWPDLLFGTSDMTRTRDVHFEAQHLTNEPTSEPLGEEDLRPKDFAFIMHPVYLTSYLHSPFVLWFTPLHDKQYDGRRWWMYLLLPYMFVIYLATSWLLYHGFNLEEEFSWQLTESATGKTRKMTGLSFVVRNAALDYFVPFKYKQINNRIANCILEAQRRNVRVVGLGALNKAEWLNHGGVDLVKMLGDKLKTTYVTHGDTMTSAVVLNMLLNLRERNFWKHRVLLIGATSKIGRAISLALAKRKMHVKMFTTAPDRFEYIRNEAGEDGCYLERVENLSDGADCDLWVTGKFKPDGFTLLNAIPRNATVVNFAVPDPLTEPQVATRPDLLHLDGGQLAYDTSKVDMEFSALLPKGMLYACLSGSVVHAAMGYNEHEIGPVRMDRLDLYWEKALECGFRLPPPTSFMKPIELPEFRLEEI